MSSELPWPANGKLDIPWTHFMREHAPDSWSALSNWMTTALETSEIDPKTAEFIIVALDAHVAWPAPFIDLHIHRAFNAGSTIRELVDVLTVAGMTLGPHVLNHGLTAVQRVVEERESLGISTPASREQA